MITENRLFSATENHPGYEAVMRQARAERAEAMRALLFSIGRRFGRLNAAIGFARRQSHSLAGARFQPQTGAIFASQPRSNPR